jgi:hypothetical protein
MGKKIPSEFHLLCIKRGHLLFIKCILQWRVSRGAQCEKLLHMPLPYVSFIKYRYQSHDSVNLNILKLIRRPDATSPDFGKIKPLRRGLSLDLRRRVRSMRQSVAYDKWSVWAGACARVFDGKAFSYCSKYWSAILLASAMHIFYIMTQQMDGHLFYSN